MTSHLKGETSRPVIMHLMRHAAWLAHLLIFTQSGPNCTRAGKHEGRPACRIACLRCCATPHQLQHRHRVAIPTLARETRRRKASRRVTRRRVYRRRHPRRRDVQRRLPKLVGAIGIGVSGDEEPNERRGERRRVACGRVERAFERKGCRLCMLADRHWHTWG